MSTCGTLTNGRVFQRKAVATAVDKIVNCTDKVMFTYGTSGTMLRLAPHELDMTKVRLFDKSVLYVVDEETEDKLLQVDAKFKSKIATARFFGNGRNNEDIYKFAVGQNAVVPITDQCCKFGDAIYY